MKTNNNFTLYISIFIICITTILVYGRYRVLNKKTYKDPLISTKIIQSKMFGDVDGWSFAHFFFFMLIGYLFPNELYLSMTFGIIWELFEHLSGKYKPACLTGFSIGYTDDAEYEGWWYGKLSDLLMNLVGFLIGSRLKLGKMKLPKQYTEFVI